MPVFSRVLAAFIGGFCFATAYAAPPVYTLDALQQIALGSNRALAAARDGVEATAAGIVTARAYPNPEAELLFGQVSGRLPGPVAGNARTLAITQRIDNPWQRDARISAAEAAARGSSADLRSTENRLLADLRIAFYAMLQRQEELQAAREDLELADSIRDKVKVRVDVGEAPRFELIRAEAEWLNAQKAEQSAALRTRQAQVAIRALVAEELPAEFGIAGDWSEPRALPPLESLVERLLQENPELVALNAAADRADQQLRLERARRMPEVAVRAIQDREPELDNNRIGLTVTIPIWDRRAGPVAEATAQLSRSRNSLEHRRFTLSQALESAWRQYDIARNQVTALEGGIVREAESALRVAESAYRFGERGILDLLDARRVFRAVRNDLIVARFDLEAARIEVDRLLASRTLSE